MRAKDGVGRYGERVAVRALEDLGMRVLETNWRCELGELDIVALDGDEVVAVEVKTRSSGEFGHPAEAVTADKLARLRRLAARWLGEHELRGVAGVRVDVVAVSRRRAGAAHVEHLRAV